MKAKTKKRIYIYFLIQFSFCILHFHFSFPNPLLIFTLVPLFYHSVADWECVLCFIIIFLAFSCFFFHLFSSIPFYRCFSCCCNAALCNILYIFKFLCSLLFQQRGLVAIEPWWITRLPKRNNELIWRTLCSYKIFPSDISFL